MQRSPLIFSGLLCLSGALHGAQAAELGDATVRSWLGQPIIADVELLPDEGGAAVQATIARPDVFRGANIAMSPVLAWTHLSVMRRDGKQFLHVTSLKAVDSNHVNLFLELTENGKHTVREVTLWFQPDPHPPAPAPVPAPPSAAGPAPAGAAATAASPSVHPAATGRPHAATANLPHAPASSPLPATTSSIPPAAAAKLEPAAVPPPVSRPLAAPAAPRTRSAASAAETAEHLRACAALDYANTRLSAQIIDLEEKVRQLQAAVGPQPAPAHKALVVPRLQLPVKPAAAKGAAPRPATNWLLYGGLAGGAAALLGAVVAILIRKRRAKGTTRQGAAAKKGALADLVDKLKRERAVPMPVTEPVLEPDPVEN